MCSLPNLHIHPWRTDSVISLTFFLKEASEVASHNCNPQICLLGNFRCCRWISLYRLLPSCHMLTLIRVHTHTIHMLHWNDINSTYTFEILLIVPCIPEEATFLTPVSYLWKNFYLPLPFVTSYWKITVISGSVGGIQNIKSLFQ